MATMTGKQVGDQARTLLNDQDKNKWPDDPDMLEAVNEAQREIAARRRDARIAADLSLVTIADITALSGNLSISDRFLPHCKAFVIAYLLGKHGKESANVERSSAAWQRYENMIAKA